MLFLMMYRYQVSASVSEFVLIVKQSAVMFLFAKYIHVARQQHAIEHTTKIKIEKNKPDTLVRFSPFLLNNISC